MRSIELGILAQPIQVGCLRRCTACGRCFAFKLVRTEGSKIAGELRIYRCAHCGHEETFARQHPPGAI
jgi:hypothetical protein